jgi:hypothetical protein
VGIFAMNFFGHALVAQRRELARGSIRAEFVLGAMLPDFASMLRSRPPTVSDDALSEGLAFHHLTDDAFHGSESFLGLSGRALSFLVGHGLSRGSARAVAHVGVELLLDGAFAAETRTNEAYLSAVDCALTLSMASRIHWLDAALATRFSKLCQNLRQRGAFPSNTPAEVMAQRLREILADRPRLAMDEAGQSVVREWIMIARPMIVSGAPLVLREVQDRLEKS